MAVRCEPPVSYLGVVHTPVGCAHGLLTFLDALDVDRAILVGSSLGGLVSLDLAVSRPDRISGLVLADIPLPGHPWSAEFEQFDDAETAAIEAITWQQAGVLRE